MVGLLFKNDLRGEERNGFYDSWKKMPGGRTEKGKNP